MYQGACNMSKSFFADQGYPCPPKMNPADHMLDCITVRSGEDPEKVSICMYLFDVRVYVHVYFYCRINVNYYGLEVYNIYLKFISYLMIHVEKNEFIYKLYDM
jgi:hypothetical protein